MFCYTLSYASSFFTQIILIFLQLHVLLQIIITFNGKKKLCSKKNSSVQLIYSNERLKSKWIQYSRT